MNKDINLFHNLCKYIMKNYQVMNSSKMTANLIYECCRELEMDVPAVEGLIFVEVNGYKRQYAHCFNVQGTTIIDASVYEFALINKRIENLFPMYIVGNIPAHIEYSIMKEIKYEDQIRFNKKIIDKIIIEAKNYNDVTIDRFSENEDSKKENLFYLRSISGV
ncbi:hypothetical protein [Clostridium pasteurianum]|nr:hypothetical protein [Clostridium pasteurianum]